MPETNNKSGFDPQDELETVENLPKKKKNKALEVIETVFVAFFLAMFIRATVAEARFIPSGSMRPTLVKGDRLIIEKVSNYLSSPQRGDILVFYPPKEGELPATTTKRALRWLGFTGEAAYIKRVVGLPGETIEVIDGTVLVNNVPLKEDYIYAPPYYDYKIKVPPKNLFMMGDNRNNSRDSHVWGPLPTKNIIGKAVLRFWPLNRLGLP